MGPKTFCKASIKYNRLLIFSIIRYATISTLLMDMAGDLGIMKIMKLDMDSRFDHQKLEPEIYKAWEKSGFFNPDNLVKKGIAKKSAGRFSMVLPPPNVTGVLHMGHAIVLTIEDIMTRFARMQGKKTLWLPGSDHAAIATQAKVEKILYKEKGQSRHDLGREEFLKLVEKFAADSHKTIVNQTRRMGASLDWSREAYTLDDQRNFAVRTAFKRMYDDGLIFRKDRVVNWDPKAQTTISDDEVVHTERKALLYTFKYSKDFPIAIATTRPETKLGDTAVAVHPSDKRYKKYVGKVYDVNFAGEKLQIKIIADKDIDPEFGTGALGVTPAHSMVDYEMSLRHNLPLKQVIDERARMTVGGEDIKDKKTIEAREVILEWLRKENLLEKTEEITQNISTAERTGGGVEPLPKLQWFVDVEKKFKIPKSSIRGIKSESDVTLKELMRTVVKNGQIKILPKRFEKEYFRWIDSLRPWCISRQIWFGHRIPVWYKENKMHVDMDAPKEKGWEQDPDTLDTWFSSSLWTFSTLGWPKQTKDLKEYHPTDVLETAYEILFFWVARMILMSTYLLGEIPFRTVYLHGLVRDEQGKKMSKSLGNSIDPVDMIELYGADAVRISLIIGAAPGSDSKTSEDKIRGYRNFTTKIWNASRFVLMSYDASLKTKPAYTAADKRNLKKLEDTKKRVAGYIEDFKFHRAAELIYQYFWHTFADKVIEQSKDRLRSGKEADRAAAQDVLMKILKESLKMLHPFMPYITESIWGKLPREKGESDMLMVEKC
ncbi:MAG: Valine-tRNA ligase [Candidatus Nomurabacteria bacterium GW2011_GWA1_46_11]|uniref:Valine--tRNA ligase n=1 Tax=Candidatus Nomurabacteria bacterium GW2011_GWA1_46_11 TaxID=1618732 RepID=A0A0G1RMR7_9BACT|nr:MAG: Valine-tRNA ligase [Candidatus Nomurabacteria bacterium GW2011_GWA1_46_11]